ncbi:cryptochrome/photolyase family protein [Thiospirillum jenense]|uniref:cryptochrome/photolyase family protein n=1 Tax=Thiospirillum jenense TaxID=1653858 RepID=UPI001EEAFAE9|nr:deoxyribodipyrimidine photo-lyase [Thiospirillum jenense]
MSIPTTALVWLRRDLRLADNPALQQALLEYERVIPIFIHDPLALAPWLDGAASRWWLHHSLAQLTAALRARGSELLIARGDSLTCLRRVIAASGARHCCWNRCYEPAAIARDIQIKQALRADGISCTSHNAALWFEPWTIQSGSGTPYRVFTAWWRRCQPQLGQIPLPSPAPAHLPPLPPDLPNQPLASLELLPRINWDSGFADIWHPGEDGAWQRVEQFLTSAAPHYATHRDLPAVDGTSRLAPYLSWGNLSPRQLLPHLLTTGGDQAAFMRELGWREFSYHLLYHFPTTPAQPLNPRFADFPWRTDAPAHWLPAWQRGQTGIPLVDAGMRQLWHCGWMHNRVRMIVASFLTKNLRLPWQLGARWFWETLVDADLANNTQGWQWTAGCGADAAPYVRIFNPVLQGQRFDPTGDYVKRWCPELAQLPSKWIHQPSAAPAAILTAAGVELGKHYPRPLVDLAQSRQEALAAWQALARSAPSVSSSTRVAKPDNSA